jgi:hypothetical protein
MKIQQKKIKVLKKKTTGLKDAGFNICKIKFPKHGLTRRKNSCQAKAATKNKTATLFIHFLNNPASNFI